MHTTFTATTSITINAPASRVWDALTNPALIKQYLFDTEVISDWKVGSALTYRGEWKGKKFEDKGIIKELQPGKKLTTTYWSSMSGSPDSPENYATVTYTLQEQGSNTTLTVSQTNHPTQEAADRSEGDWNYVVGSLKKILESNEI